MPIWLVLWGIVPLMGFGLGLPLLVMGLRSRFRGTAPHCAKCNYNLTGRAYGICPECGTELTSVNVVTGKRYRRPRLIVIGSVLLIMGPLSWVVVVIASFVSTPTRMPARPVSADVRKAKWVIAELNSMVQASTTSGASHMREAGLFPKDKDMQLLALQIQSKIPALLVKRLRDPGILAAAQAELAAANELFQAKILPAQRAAVQSKDPADVQALASLIDQLDMRMDKLLQILNGY